MPKLIDCVTYLDEDLLLDLRFNVLNQEVSKFIVVEAKQTHQGEKKKLNFDINNFKKFKNKIEYIVQEDLNKDEFKLPDSFHRGFSKDFSRENSQRNYIMHGIKKNHDDDFIMISDCDEIPKLKSLVTKKIYKKFFLFKQDLFYYKFNLKCKEKTIGTRLCKKKYLLSPQSLRNIYPKRKFAYNFRNCIQIIKDGGWHFSYLKEPKEIIDKLEQFAHSEYNKKKYKDINHIKNSVKQGKDLLGRNIEFFKTEINKDFPEFLRSNIKQYKKWII